MPKILVADDNSNVQKTVTLALAELGVDVVSVNNGEAAVRKLSDFVPDLVLADIFMPVRNGYEVCEYVKKDARFSRVPVVLLVGAFDPLDEREAQRVGADGILKKPFVPPDPLITMVKTLLERTLSERLVTVAASTPPAAVQARSGGSAIAGVDAPAPELPEEPPAPEFPSPAQRVAFGEGARPVAFGTLLETPAHESSAQDSIALEPVDDEQILTSSRDTTLGEPMFWKNDSEEQEPVAEPSHEALPVPEIGAWKQHEESLPRVEETPLLHVVEPIELVHEEHDEASPSVVDPGSILQDPARMATLNVEPSKAEDLAANPLEWMATTTHPEPSVEAEEVPEATPGWDEPIPDASDTIDKEESPEEATVLAPKLPPASPAEFVRAPAPVSPPASAPAPTPVLAAVETPVAVKSVLPANSAPAISEAPAPAPQQPNVKVIPAVQSTEDTAHSIPKQEWSDLAASILPSATKQAAQLVKSEPLPAAQVPVAPAGGTPAPLASSAQEASPDAALVEAVVQRVLDKMRPQVVDIITKEFLRPIVQALVHREIDKH